MLKPTEQTYNELQVAYEYYNTHLFDGDLPPCLITLQRSKKTYGYFSPDRFVSRESEITDEIAMNPTYFATRKVEEVLSTLVHEMVHLWQYHYGKPGRGRYHNRQWAEKMQSIGLMPSHTSAEGGKTTGDKVSHYIIDGGLFDEVSQSLLTDCFVISWLDRYSFLGRKRADGLDGIDATLEEELSNLGISVEPEGNENKSNRSKYSHICSGNKVVNVWGKAELDLICGICGKSFEPV